MAAPDYYRELGVADTASADQVKKAYRKLAKQHHPDVNPGSAERFKRISEAYAVLGNDEKRRQYDEMRRLGAFAGFGGDARARGGGRSGGPGGAGGRGFEFDLGDLGLGDIFGQMFGGRQPRRGPARGADRLVSLTVPFRAAVLGDKVRVQVPVEAECPTCKGSGAAPGSKLETCSECGGSGTVSMSQGAFAVTRPCPRCGGRGKIPSKPCPRCGGEGTAETTRTLEVAIPSGIEDGGRIRLRGQGDRGPNGGPPGDLLVEVTVEPDRFFKRRGLDLVTDVPINVAQALLGSRIRVRTVRGRKEEVEIPPGTQNATEFRLRGHGIEKGPRRGDQVVRVNVQLPGRLDPEAREAARKLAETLGLKH
ncbi:MAG TPA: molecular chaperone DnaJ [Gemmatimonadota bacterium]